MRVSPKLYLIAALSLLAGCATGGAMSREAGDTYANVAALKAAQVEGRDYSSETYPRGSQVAVFAIHGGDIEPNTALVARAVAGNDLNLYVFSGWGLRSARLHITATHFDDPAAQQLAAVSALGVSIHEQNGRGDWVCVGGSNASAALLMAARLDSAGFESETPCTRLPGVSKNNIVNRTAAGGVQLEMTARMLRRLATNAADLSKFTLAVRTAALEYLKQYQTEKAQQEQNK